MNYSVDVSFEYKSIKSKFLRISLLFSLIFTLVLVADVLLVVLSKEKYTAPMIIAIVISVLFCWFAIFFFTNIFNEINGKYRYFKGYESGLKSTDEVEFLQQSDQLTYMNGLYVYPVYVRFITNLYTQEKIIFTLKKDLGLKSGDRLTITTYQRVIMSMEKH